MYKDNVIIIGGRKRVGKDTVATLLVKYIGKAKCISLASPMKEILADTLGISVEEVERLKNNESNPHRGYLQRFGQKAKEYFGEECWIEYNRHVIANLPKGTTAIIPDFRYPNETKAGDITINVVNPKLPGVTDNHSSENSMNNFEFDYTIINNGTLEDLENTVENLVLSWRAEARLS